MNSFFLNPWILVVSFYRKIKNNSPRGIKVERILLFGDGVLSLKTG
ncbi:hypothetical protein ISN45_At02g006770 [Arabidopsis thaliana x Arabidopsis arenosa]|uniref:Uncharacterized protein n=1 Tax=Arabidopsis thaliana x Arabidopsis arenosa TaxID=1240361 RepID=A0A8T2FPB2_9BRAS|nr:hypothetical protein ISN45_At02g006770 [Arabidopsis thaliana x Arabidopsis arenosa]